MLRSRPVRFAGLAIFAVFLAALSYAFTAGNTVPASRAGDGSNAISGYTITNVTYSLGNSDPSRVNGVAFYLTPDGGGGQPDTLKVRLIDPSGVFYSTPTQCGLDAQPATNWTCSWSPTIALFDLNQLRLIAVQ